MHVHCIEITENLLKIVKCLHFLISHEPMNKLVKCEQADPHSLPHCIHQNCREVVPSIPDGLSTLATIQTYHYIRKVETIDSIVVTHKKTVL